MIRLAIVDDEKQCTDQLTKYVYRFQKEKGCEIKVTCFSDGSDIVENYSGEYDIILMDIQMILMNGMDAAEKIRQIDREVIIIFITNMTNYAIRGYEVDALDYIVKPVEYFAFSQKLQRAVSRIRERKRHYLSIPIENGVRKLDVEEMYYIESQGHNLLYNTKEGEFVSRGTIKSLEEILIPYGFYRSSKGFLVNMKYVEGIKDNICFVQGENIPVSRPKRKEFMMALLDYMSEVMR